MWFAVSAIASGGLAGLFLLAFLMARATRTGVYAGIAASTVFTIWAVLTKGARPIVDVAPFNFPFDELTIGGFGNLVLFLVGAGVSLLTATDPPTGDLRSMREQCGTGCGRGTRVRSERQFETMPFPATQRGTDQTTAFGYERPWLSGSLPKGPFAPLTLVVQGPGVTLCRFDRRGIAETGSSRLPQGG